MKYCLLFLLLISENIFAAGKGHGSVLDLMYPAINFIVLFGALFFMLKKPIKEMFDKNADDVKYQVELADQKEKEANIRYEMVQSKLSNLQKEKEKITEDSEKEFQSFQNKTKEENNSYVKRITDDVDTKLATEKKAQLKAIETSIVEEIIEKAKSKISSDSSVKQKATNKLFSQIK